MLFRYVLPRIGHDVVPRLGRDGSQFGVRAQCAIRFADQQLVAGNNQQPYRLQPIEAERNRIDTLITSCLPSRSSAIASPAPQSEKTSRSSCQRGEARQARSEAQDL